jgi:hypothetical protein
MKLKSSFVLFFVCTALVLSASAQAATAKILDLKGQVQIRENEAQPWRDVKKNQSIKEGSSILTGEDSFCDVGFIESSKGSVKIQENSRALITSADPVKVRIEQGRVFAFVKEIKKNVNFEVSTITAIAAARGTGWLQDSKQIAVFDETVHVESQSGDKMDISEGKGIALTEDGHFGEMFDVQEGLAAAWQDFKNESNTHLNNAVGTEALAEIDAFDPTEDLLETKEDFSEINEQEELQATFNETVTTAEEDDRIPPPGDKEETGT